MAETELQRAEQRYAQAKARLQALKNREATRERKMDTRRKVILGGALLDLANRDSRAAAMIDRLVHNLPREQDRKAFDDWVNPASALIPSTGTDAQSGAGTAAEDDGGRAAVDTSAPSATSTTSASDTGTGRSGQ
ncbi:mobilization protein [Loktanella sp. M215]|uniref:mobilization protein n=1 Tax=Loktanella sp. M215 TaxID=2675431 RepID=UPI001F4571ED|nr:mobilization protein [Loktanella sp. M215]